MGERDTQKREADRRPGSTEPLRDGGDVSDPGASGSGRADRPTGERAAPAKDTQAGPGPKPGKRPA